MRDVVVIGGGLTGLAAAWSLERAGVSYTMIEVKPRMGGGMQTIEMGPFRFDAGPMQHPITDLAQFSSWMETLGLGNAYTLQNEEAVFNTGTGALIDALESRITAPIMRRMAVSTLGQMDKHWFSICMENGMVMDTRALIIASPARYAERMLYTLVQEIAVKLLDYRYDHIARLSLGYNDVSLEQLNLTMPEDFPIAAIQSTAQPQRTPENGCIIQVALRYDPTHGLPDDPVGETAALMGWPLNPDADNTAIWTESDPIMFLRDEWLRDLEFIQNMLPQGVTLVGSDYIATDRPPRIDERMQQGINAAEKVIAWLNRV